jgi:hypothetical protein
MIVGPISPEQAVAVAEHHHYSIIVLFVLGYLLHVGLQIGAVARAKNNPTNSRLQILEQNMFRFAARFFVSLMAFLFLWHNPSAVPSLLGVFGISVGTTATAILTLPISQPIAGMFGFFADSLLAYIPFLKNALPPVVENGSALPSTGKAA